MTLKDENFKRIIIPSRGAYPFYDGARKSLHLLTDSSKDIVHFQKHFNVWLLPFTSDWGESISTITSDQIRKFWSKVLADIIRKENTVYSKFYNTLVDHVGKNLTINTSELKLSRQYKLDKSEDEKFIFIDTAISGRAICEIIQSFYDFNLTDFFIILLVDKKGNKLNREYKTIIEREKNRNRLYQIDVECIFSEDASPLLNSGIASIVFPSLLERAYAELPAFKNDGFIGGGLWFIDSTSHLRSFSPNLNKVHGILGTLLYKGLFHNLSHENIWSHELASLDTENIINLLGDFNLFDPVNTKELVYERIISRKKSISASIDVSSSHVVRINLDSDLITEFIRKVKNN
ncbi:hypothetical protein [uncultured Spirosoma sp.]|uniref:hypothetical protein n=1 Tax=uncultured Spirosoma sp. TaxID=278208 RepID=UPI002588314A|nr:hypothetical protein [uncultured Spirosoma sp.]